MKRAVLSFAAALAIAGGFAATASAAGVSVCNETRAPVIFFLGYVRDGGLESTGAFQIAPGQCRPFLGDISAGPFYIYAGVATGAMSWTGKPRTGKPWTGKPWTTNGDESAEAFCLSALPNTVIRNAEHIKNGKLACPSGPAGRFIRIPDAPHETAKFTFREDNATDRPPAAPARAAAAAPPKPKTITCPFLKEGRVTFDIPAQFGGLPAAIDFDYPAKAKEFSFRDGNLFLLAMDETEPTRVRIMISAQRDRTTGAYAGQIFVDMGGHQFMLHNGPVRCVVGAP